MNIQKTIQKIVNTTGYEIHKVNHGLDLSLYLEIYGEKAVKNKRFYNIGSGSFSHPAWTNIDLPSKWYEGQQANNIDIELDLMSLKAIPIDNNIAEIVYSSHTIEHISNDAVQNMFNEVYRILKKGGIFRVTTPNIDLDYRAYKDNDKHYYYFYTSEWIRHTKLKTLNEQSIQQFFLHHFASNISTLKEDGSLIKISNEALDRIFQEMEYKEALDYCISKCLLSGQQHYMGNHMNWFNKDKIFQMLSLANFDNIHLSGYGQSFSPVLRNTSLFDNTHPKISLYIEAIK